MTDLAITPLCATEAAQLRELLDADDPEYSQYFVSFGPGLAAIAQAIDAAQRDRYWGIRFSGRLVGFLMLRGLDAGFAAPAFGTYIAGSSAGKGLGRLALEFATTWCRLNGVHQIMLSVHPDNRAARHLYETCGFAPDGTSTPRGHRVYRKTLT